MRPSWVGRLVARLVPRRIAFDTDLVHVESVVSTTSVVKYSVKNARNILSLEEWTAIKFAKTE
jgi:hypothetical protein